MLSLATPIQLNSLLIHNSIFSTNTYPNSFISICLSIYLSFMSTEMIEHVVMFNVDDDQDPEKVNTWLSDLASLSSLEEALHLTVGPIFRPRAFPEALHFTHILHARYPSLADLQSYSSHPDHLHAVSLGQPITSDLIALDWAWSRPNHTPCLPLLGRALRFTFLKLKEEKKEGFVEEMHKIKERCVGSVEEMTFGEEVSIARGKGFNFAVVAVFRDLNELDACEEFEDSMKTLLYKNKSFIDGVICVDYVVPRAGPTTPTV